MKKVDGRTRLQIADLIAEQGLRISEFALEKDFMVFDALKSIAAVKHPQFELVFCGGTCLSKAYGILDRVSEDVDVKVVAKPGTELKGSSLRTELSGLKKRVGRALEDAGFEADAVKVSARDGNRYVVLDAGYASHFEASEPMRAQLKVELNYSTAAKPFVQLPIGRLFDVLAGTAGGASFAMPCVDLREALVEKMLSFPRRLALHMQDPSRGFDQALVRHIHDVHEIAAKRPEVVSSMDDLRPIMLSAMEKDAADFAGQHPGFLSDPVGELERAMEFAGRDPSIRKMFERFVAVMVYAPEPPTFDRAFALYGDVFDRLKPERKVEFQRFARPAGLTR